MADRGQAEVSGPSANAPAIASKIDLAVEIRRLLLIHERRTGKPIKRTTLARLIGVSPSSVYAYLNGTTLAPTDTFDRLLDVIDVPPATRKRLSTARDHMASLGKLGTDPEPAAQLPLDVSAFTGRTPELDQLSELLTMDGTGPVVVSAIDGMGGIGKSALAIHAAHKLRQRFPDGQLYVNLHGASPGVAPLQPGEVLAHFLCALGVAAPDIPTDTDEAAARFRSLLDRRHVLVVLDNAADAIQVRPLLPASPTCAAVVTSRRALVTIDGATHLHLDVLRESEATTLLGRLAGAQRIAAEPDAAARIARLCGYVPLALRIAAARLSARPSWPVSALAERLRDAHRRLDELHVDDLAVRASFGVGYHDLRARADGRPAARMFRLLGLHPGPDIGVPAAAALAGLPVQQAESVLESLVDSHLLESRRSGRYQLHDLLRCYAADRATADEPASERIAAVHRALTWYLHCADAVDRQLAPGRDHVVTDRDRVADQPQVFSSYADALRWYQAEHRNIVAATRWAAENGMDDLAWRIPVALGVAFEQGSPRTDAITLGRAAVASARRINDRYAQVRALNALGNAYCTLGQFNEAISCHQQGLAINREIGYRRGEVSCLNNLGACYQYQGQMRQAFDYYGLSVEIALDSADRYSQCTTLTSLGEACHGLGRFREAIDCYTRALDTERIANYPFLEGACLAYLALAYAATDCFTEAMSCCDRSLGIHRTLNNRYGEAETLIILAEIHARRHQHGEAERYQREALGVLNELKSPDTDRLRTRLRAIPVQRGATPRLQGGFAG